MNMTIDQEIKIKSVLSEFVLKLDDKSKEQVIRQIIFSLADNIDWHTVKNLICNYMPELAKKFDNV